MGEWFVRQPDGEPVGPVSTELLLRGVEAGKVPTDSLVCRAGEQAWRPLLDVPMLRQEVLRARAPAPAFSPGLAPASNAVPLARSPLVPPELPRSGPAGVPSQPTSATTSSSSAVAGPAWAPGVPSATWGQAPVWHLRRRGEVGGPYDEATIEAWIRAGMTDGEICAPGGAWMPLDRYARFARALANTGGGPLPTTDVVVLTVAWLVAIAVAFAGTWWALAVVLVATLVYADARACGIRKWDITAMGWALLTGLFLIVALPAYAVLRGRLKTRPGNPFLFAGALAAGGMIVAASGLVLLASAARTQATIASLPTDARPVAVSPPTATPPPRRVMTREERAAAYRSCRREIRAATATTSNCDFDRLRQLLESTADMEERRSLKVSEWTEWVQEELAGVTDGAGPHVDMRVLKLETNLIMVPLSGLMALPETTLDEAVRHPERARGKLLHIVGGVIESEQQLGSTMGVLAGIGDYGWDQAGRPRRTPDPGDDVVVWFSTPVKAKIAQPVVRFAGIFGQRIRKRGADGTRQTIIAVVGRFVSPEQPARAGDIELWDRAGWRSAGFPYGPVQR